MRLQKVISNLRPEVRTIGDFRVAQLTHQSMLTEIKRAEVDAIVAHADELVGLVLSDDDLYLLPLFVVGSSNRQSDGEFLENEPTRQQQKIDKILHQIRPYYGLPLPTDPDRRLLTRLLRYLWSRHTTLQPANTRQSIIGYTYPLVEDMSIEKDPLRIMAFLDSFTTEGLFRSSAMDKVNVCYECQSSYLNFSECCTKCTSIDLKTEELVHHFRCAYVGPQSDFTKNDKLVCPKCDHQLKHIGIDYDKPSEIHTCKSCNHSSQETKMKARCVDCAKENELDQLTTFTISRYHPTEKSKDLAQESEQVNELVKMAEQEHDFLTSPAAFGLLVSHESRKSVIGNLSAYHLTIEVGAAVMTGLNDGMKIALLQELAYITKPYLKDADLLSISDGKSVQALLLQYDQETVGIINDTLSYNLNKMLKDNQWCAVDTITVTCKPLQS